MTVQDLRDTLTQLVGLLRAADAKPATTRDLADFVEAIGSFGDVTLKAFVKLAEAGRTPSAAPAEPRPRPTPAPRVDAGAAAAEVKNLYDRAASPEVSEDQIREACGRLGGLAKDALVKVADGIELFGMRARAKGDIQAAITARLVDRKGAAIRRQLIDRPAPVG